ncbi:MAG: hypothetical protein K6T65_05430 [Peptococcaceae bacterium]|nr:hypothetical protein [Peptococcaceae bacterium]
MKWSILDSRFRRTGPCSGEGMFPLSRLITLYARSASTSAGDKGKWTVATEWFSNPRGQFSI